MIGMSGINRRMFVKAGAVAAASLGAGGVLAGCGGDEAEPAVVQAVQQAAAEEASAQAQDTVEKPGSGAGQATAAGSVLVAYFSGTGNTERAAEAIAAQLGADAFQVQPAQPYTEADLRYNDFSSRVSLEHEDPGLQDVELKQASPDGWDAYSTVVLGYPIWWGGPAWPMTSFVRSNDFDGKTVIPFVTSGGSGLGQSAEELEAAAGAGTWQRGKDFSSDVTADEAAKWAAGLGI